MSQFPQSQLPFPQQQMPVQQFVPQQMPQQMPQQQVQQFVPQQQGQQQQFQQPQMPQLQRVPLGQGYAPGQFPHENVLTIVGQIFPNQWMPSGIQFEPGEKPRVNINLKVRNAWGQQPNQVKIQFLRLVAFGPLAQQLASGFRMGQIVRVTGEFRPNRYKSNRGQGPMKQVNQVILDGRGNNPIQLIGELPMYEEFDPMQQQGGGFPQQQGGGFPQQAPSFNQPMQQQPFQQQMPVQQQQPPMQQFQQPPQQQFQQPPQQQQPQQQAPGQFVPQQQFQPHGQFPPQQGNVQSAGVPIQPAPGQTTGNFTPPPQQMQPQVPGQQFQTPGAPPF